ncbi:MAG TPA: TMEM165/GDT1 family protein [Ilumatobacter sp.]
MTDALIAVFSTFGIVFVAELGDKTQLLALGFGARYRLRTVAIGLAVGYAAAGAIAALVGGVLGTSLPDRPLGLAGGALFVVFAVLVLRDRDDRDPRVVATRSAIASIALTIAIAEMGDKTQLATATLATRGHPVEVWVGATLGEVTAGMLGAVAGRRIGTRLEPRVLRIASAAMFAGFGVVLLLTAW